MTENSQYVCDVEIDRLYNYAERWFSMSTFTSKIKRSLKWRNPLPYSIG